MRKYNLQVQLSRAEQYTLKIAADSAGLTVSDWLRDRLRKAARVELQGAGIKVPFLENVGLTPHVVADHEDSPAP